MILDRNITLKMLADEEYRRLAEKHDFLTKKFEGKERYAYGEIVSEHSYSGFSDVLALIRKNAVEKSIVRLIHAPGRNYKTSEIEFKAGKSAEEYYACLAERAEQANALNVELLIINDAEKRRTYRGNKLIFRKNKKVYLAKLYVHISDLRELG